MTTKEQDHAEHFAACAAAARERGDLEAAAYYEVLAARMRGEA